MEDPASQDPLVGLKLGEYELRQRIGVGGMGLVYDGIQPLIGKRVAVKVLRPELAAAEEQVARLLAEARAVNAIRHRGIVDIFGFGQVPDGRQYIIMEYLEGVALDAYLAEKGRVPVPEALDILDEVLSALGAAHGAGVVHRDLKPSNIFLVQQPDGSRYVKLLDFGLAKMGLPTGRTAQTRTDMVVGTPEYMAPEQARGQPVGPMTDLYALGVVAFEMVTGRLPFTGTSPVDLLMKHVDARPPKPSEFVPELPGALDAFILQMLTKDPEARPGSAETLRRQLARLRESLSAPAAPAAPTSEPAVPAAHGKGKPTVSEHPVEAHPEPEAAKPAKSTPEKSTPVKPTPASSPEPSPEDVRAAGVTSPMRRLLPIGLGAAALLAVGGVVFALREPASGPVAVTPPAPVTPKPQPEVKPPPPVANTTAQVQKDPPPAVQSDAGTPPPTELAVTPLGHDTPPVEPVPAVAHSDTPETQTAAQKARQAPTVAVLLGRIRKLDKELDTRAQAGRANPAAQRTLKDIQHRAESAGTPDERRQVAKEISDWEKFFLSHK